MSRTRLLAVALLLVIGSAFTEGAAEAPKSYGPIKTADMKEWLGFLASDELEGRDTYTEGLGIAAQYIAERLKSWGVKPGGDNGSYFQRVAVVGVKSTDNSTITVETNGQTRTFKSGEAVTVSRPVGGKRSFSSDQIEFVGYGVSLPSVGHDDYAKVETKGKIAVWIGNRGPEKMGNTGFRLMGNRGRVATEEKGAIATISPGFGGGGRRGGGAPPPAAGAVQQPETPDFTTAEKLDSPRPPLVSARDEFLDFLFSGQEAKYPALKELANARGPLPRFSLKGVKITFNLDATYRIIKTQYTRNVVGIVEGRDKKLRDTFVAFGAHYDHVGYSDGEVIPNESGGRRQGARGRVTAGTVADRIWNGADDDGSGTVALLSLAKAFAKGPKPKRSLLFVWHAGEEKGLLGSKYFADVEKARMGSIVTQLNIDMIGRNRDNKKEEEDVVYLVGADRISTELHNHAVEANAASPLPMKLSFEFNDPVDPEQIYYRSDHHSYAARGVPIIFFTTGLHPDYHANTDSPDRIEYDKMARISRLVYDIGLRVANLDEPVKRDFKGSRANKQTTGALPAEG